MATQHVLCILIPFAVLVCGMPKYEPKKPTQPTPTEPVQVDGPRAVYAGKQSNYTLGFVPLITVISNIIPRIINRYSQPTTQTTMARSAGTRILQQFPKDLSNTKPCIDSKLGRWPYPENQCLFYQCELNIPTPTECMYKISFDPSSDSRIDRNTIAKDNHKMVVNECVKLGIYSCIEGYVFDPNKITCIKKSTEKSACSMLQQVLFK